MRQTQRETLEACRASMKAHGEIRIAAVAGYLGVSRLAARHRLWTLKGRGVIGGRTHAERAEDAAGARQGELERRIEAVRSESRRLGRALSTDELYRITDEVRP